MTAVVTHTRGCSSCVCDPDRILRQIKMHNAIALQKGGAILTWWSIRQHCLRCDLTRCQLNLDFLSGWIEFGNAEAADLAGSNFFGFRGFCNRSAFPTGLQHGDRKSV